MNIDDMKLGDLKKIAAMFGGGNAAQSSIYAEMIGKYAIIRSRNEGINAGYIEQADGTGIVLKSARRIWYHKPANKKESWYEGVANSGLSDDSKVSGVVVQKVIVEDYSVTVCTEEAKQSIEAAVANAQG